MAYRKYDTCFFERFAMTLGIELDYWMGVRPMKVSSGCSFFLSALRYEDK